MPPKALFLPPRSFITITSCVQYFLDENVYGRKKSFDEASGKEATRFASFLVKPERFSFDVFRFVAIGSVVCRKIAHHRQSEAGLPCTCSDKLCLLSRNSARSKIDDLHKRDCEGSIEGATESGWQTIKTFHKFLSSEFSNFPFC